MKKKLIWFVIIVVLAGATWWYAQRAGWFTSTGPTNLPTAAELQRMREIEESSSKIAPNAKAGAGVLPPGSTPPPIPTGTTSGSSTPQ